MLDRMHVKTAVLACEVRSGRSAGRRPTGRTLQGVYARATRFEEICCEGASSSGRALLRSQTTGQTSLTVDQGKLLCFQLMRLSRNAEERKRQPSKRRCFGKVRFHF